MNGYELFVKVPLDVWQLIFPTDVLSRRITYLSLLQTSKPIRIHLLSFFNSDPNRFNGLFEGYYTGKTDGLYFVKLDRTKSYLRVERNDEREVKTEGTWKVIKTDISYASYSLEIQFMKSKKSVEWFYYKNNSIVEKKSNLKQRPTPTLIFSRCPKIDFPIDSNDDLIVKINQKEFEVKRKRSCQSYPLYNFKFQEALQLSKETATVLFPLIPTTVTNYSELVFQTPSILKNCAKLTNTHLQKHQSDEIIKFIQYQIVQSWMEISPTISTFLNV
eukprot:TRINITY_DN18414_c0_g1_i1.p1 TRINITY_DN18414_c0_g1~~TRINITY_DN18414_c0_g1_i1.p1  ORF type:complete len:282 (+),score=63.75 TRINITY_DN18414_c0_g1_i1:26-847(+)